jgi:hypothetical protein
MEGGRSRRDLGCSGTLAEGALDLSAVATVSMDATPAAGQAGNESLCDAL